MLLEKTISPFTKLESVKWGNCPLCGRADAFLVKEKRWKCYGCGLGGDVIDFLVYSRGLTPKQATQELKKLKAKHAREGKKRGPGRPKKGD